MATEWEYTPWMPDGEVVRVDDKWITVIDNGFGQSVQKAPVPQYRYTEKRWKIRVTRLPDGRLWGEREPEIRTYQA